MKFGIVTFPGSNCDYDAYQAVVESLGEQAVYLWHKATDLQRVDAVILPGGFSYGDYLRAGAIARFSPIMAAVAEHAQHGRPVIGICNGFQIACEAGLLPGALMRNASLKFVSEWTRLRVENTATAFTNAYADRQVITIPIAHGDGRYTADADTLERLEGDGQVVFRYVGGPAGADEWWSPNGSMHAIAGIVNGTGNVIGLMPHPERAVDEVLGSTDGLGLFQSLLATVGA